MNEQTPPAGDGPAERLVRLPALKLASGSRANSLQRVQQDTSGIQVDCCATCRYWYEDSPSAHWTQSYEQMAELGGIYGECKRHAPEASTTRRSSDGLRLGEWPWTDGVEWCGDHARR